MVSQLVGFKKDLAIFISIKTQEDGHAAGTENIVWEHLFIFSLRVEIKDEGTIFVCLCVCVYVCVCVFDGSRDKELIC